MGGDALATAAGKGVATSLSWTMPEAAVSFGGTEAEGIEAGVEGEEAPGGEDGASFGERAGAESEDPC